MTTPEWIPGYLGTIEIGTDDLSASGMVVGLAMTKNALDKPTFGDGYMARVSGMRDGTLTAQGHASGGPDNELQKLFALFESVEPVAFSVQMGDPTNGPDGGIVSGNGIISDYSITGDATDEWEWSISMAFSGAYTYTPAPPPA